MPRKIAVLTAALGAFVIVGLGLVSVTSFQQAREDQVAAAAPTRSADPVRLAVVGDSLSAGRTGLLSDGLSDKTWMTYADGDGIDFVGGWARAGATPDQMASSVQPIPHVDVLVILAGTNAVLHQQTVAEEAAAYDRIVRIVRPERVLVSKIPPYRAHATRARTYNADLQALVENRGWTWIDPWTSARDGDDWAPGFSTDGTHPAGPAQYRVLGEAFRRIILESRTLPSARG